jgi:hypothetical protein
MIDVQTIVDRVRIEALAGRTTETITAGTAKGGACITVW